MMTPAPIRLLVHGARGKMGARIAALAHHDSRFAVAAHVDRDDNERVTHLAPGSVDVIVDFSSDEGAQHAAELTARLHCALLVGTTGLSSKSLDFIGVAARFAPVMIAPNTSRGVAVLNRLAVIAARFLGSAYEIDLIESHHSMKRDAPSGTALRLQQSLREGAGVNLPQQRIHSIRDGEVIGEHSLQFAGSGEILKISHSATSRDLFARGALDAAAWLHSRPPGHYRIEQAFGMEPHVER
jgi:4-hydroxy-tetrahydrodipicolinate reductase